MTGPYATAIIVASLVLCGWAVVLLIANRPPGRAVLVGAAVLEALLAGFLAWGVVAMIRTEHDWARLEFVGYLLACVALLPAAVWWVRDERSRAASGVLAVAFLVVPILVVRVQQVWAGPGG